MLEFISSLWGVWVLAFLISAGVVGYTKWQESQRKDFILTGTALGCLTIIFTIIGVMAAGLSIVASVFKLITWKITNG